MLVAAQICRADVGWKPMPKGRDAGRTSLLCRGRVGLDELRAVRLRQNVALKAVARLASLSCWPATC